MKNLWLICVGILLAGCSTTHYSRELPISPKMIENQELLLALRTDLESIRFSCFEVKEAEVMAVWELMNQRVRDLQKPFDGVSLSCMMPLTDEEVELASVQNDGFGDFSDDFGKPPSDDSFTESEEEETVTFRIENANPFEVINRMAEELDYYWVFHGKFALGPKEQLKGYSE